MKRRSDDWVNRSHQYFEQSNQFLRQCQSLDRFIEEAMQEGDDEALLVFIAWRLKYREKSDHYCDQAFQLMDLHKASDR